MVGTARTSADPKASISASRIPPLTKKRAFRQAEFVRWAKSEHFGELNSPADLKASISANRIRPLTQKRAVRQAEFVRWAKSEQFGESNLFPNAKAGNKQKFFTPLKYTCPYSSQCNAFSMTLPYHFHGKGAESRRHGKTAFGNAVGLI